MSSDDPTEKINKRQGTIDPIRILSNTVGQLNQKIDQLDAKIDARLYDTRPMWEAVSVQLSEVIQRLDKIESGMELLVQDMFELRSSQRKLSARVEQLESKA